MSNEMVVFQAISFYNAYINLEKLNNESGGMHLFVPMVINGAFSIEITLKAILINSNISFKREHNLVVLFKLLPETIQEMIWEWVANKTSEYANEERRNTEFILLSDVFKQWRYAYENSVPAFDVRFLSSLANATIGVMFKLGYNFNMVSENTNNIENEINNQIEENRSQFITKNMRYISRETNR